MYRAPQPASRQNAGPSAHVMGFRFDIEEAPKRVSGDKWRMKVRGHMFVRD